MQASPSRLRTVWKGKEKADDAPVNDDFDDLDPVITYRHLLSQNLGIRDPLRVIALCDSDAFYAACEMVRLGITDKPLVVLQWESLIAVNYPARKFGISRMDKLKDAKQRCPDLVVVHVATYKEGQKEPGYWDNVDSRTHKVSLDYYRRESMKILGMFNEHLPDAEIEKASIDEAFIDFTKPVRQILIRRYPYLSVIPADSPDGMDTPLPPAPSISWDKAGFLIPIDPSTPVDQEPGSHAPSNEEGIQDTWHDIALSIAAELMGQVREDIETKLGYTLSAGIARNKFLAKLTASYRKPNSQSILRNAAIPGYLKPMDFQKIRFLGGKLGHALAQEYDVSKVADLLPVTLDEMQQKFGENAIWVYEVLRWVLISFLSAVINMFYSHSGIDRSEVKTKSIVNKSMLASKNLPKPITKPSEGHHWIRVLAAELTLRLNDAREANPNLWPKTLVLHARKGYEASRSKQAPFPFIRQVTVDVIAAAGDKLWEDLVGNSTSMRITSVQLAFTGIETAEIGQQSIVGFFKAGPSSKRGREYDSPVPVTELPVDQSSTAAGQAVAFTCSRCNKDILFPSTASVSEEDQTDLLATVRMEHSDWHFAQDLAKDPGNQLHAPLKEPANKKTRRKESPKGIEKFFTRK
ncbi:DNA polymerase eta [Guyanagaster necrorhizus]|uniref:DNA polymerase eta n=1 Tax=Guyanagaster necrorhizus TaxID=856835 RepID=A0A9P7W2K1_9AGAR|nr:DNA polymerase eta [Guyanagaster necrorhizus MCA 3950]KAG7451043.1 DNA polymerase eta [Guyanagaster necrorhizus MCA 3950]